jgi:hypothetical protein
MTTLTLSSRQSGTARSDRSFITYLRSKWTDYRLMRSLESVPYEVMKDIGFPTAEREHGM